MTLARIYEAPPAFPSDEDQAALRFAASGYAALCTIVGIEGSFSRRLGAQLAIDRSGAIAGCLSDGCLEGELAYRAREAQSTGEIKHVRYGKGSPFLDFRLPCGSGIDVLIDPRPDSEVLRSVVSTLDRRDCATLELPATKHGLLRQRRFMPALRLLIFGNSSEASALARMAASYGLGVEVRTPASDLSLNQPPLGVAVDRWTAIVLLFHDHEWERAIFEWALSTDTFFIGALGGKVAREHRTHWLKSRQFCDDAIRRIHSPVGLIAQTRDSRTLALSVLAEVVDQYEQLRA